MPKPFAVLTLLLLAASTYAQNIGETILVQVVEVPVTVTGADGKVMRGLTKGDFELYDEGKKIPIEYFEVLDMKAIESGKSKEKPPAAATRNFLLLFDLANSSPGVIKRAADAAKNFVNTQLGALDLAAVATFTTEQGARMITSFTADKKMLTAAVDSLGNPQYFQVADPLMISYRNTSSLDSAAMAVGTGTSDRDEARIQREAAQQETADVLLDPTTANKFAQQAHATEMRNRLRIQLSNMGSVARMLDSLHGRKEIILLSEGFDPRLIRGEEAKTDRARQEEDRKRMVGEVWNTDSEQRFGTSSSSRDVSEMVELFRRSDVVLHAIDIKGLRGNTDAGSMETGSQKSNESLFIITRPTGGTVFQNSNDIGATFARMLEQQEVVYLIGFRATSGASPGKFHDLKVKTNLRGARVSHRAGYYEPSLRSTNIEKTLTTAEIMLTDAPVHDIDVRLSATTLPGPDGKARVPVFVELEGSSLLEGLYDTTATANLFLYAFDAKNNVQDYLTQRLSLNLNEARDAMRNGLTYFGTLRLPPGDYAIKAVARVEDSNRAGAAHIDVHVPQFGQPLVLQPLFLDDMFAWAMLGGPARGDNYPYPFGSGEEQYVPRGRAVLKSGGDYKIALLAYDVSLDNADLTSSIVGPDGKARPATVSIAGRTAPDGWNGTRLTLSFKPEGLAPGAYELRLGVKPQGGEESQFMLPFMVE